MVSDEVGLYYNLDTKEIYQRDLGKLEFKPVNPKNIRYGKNIGGDEVRKMVETLQVESKEIQPITKPTIKPSTQPKKISPGDYKGASYEQQAQAGLQAGRLTKGVTESQASFKYRLASLGREEIAKGDPRKMGVTLTAVPFGKEFVGPMPSPTKMIKGSVISSFEPFRIPLSEELGVRVGAFESLTKEIGKEFRTLFNIRTGEDLTSNLGASAVLRDISGTKIKSPEELYGFGTEIKYQKGIYRPDLTIGEISRQQALTGQLGKPVEFVIQDIAKGEISMATGKLGKETERLQKEIYSGGLTLEQAEKMQEGFRKGLEIEAQTSFGKKQEEFLNIRGIAESQQVKKYGKQKILPLVEYPLIIGGLAFAPVTAGTLLASRGGLKMFSSVTEPTITKKALTIGSGALEIGIGTNVAFRSLERQIAKGILTEATMKLEKTPLQTVELRIPKGEKEFMLIKSQRGLSWPEITMKQEVDAFGVAIRGKKAGTFIVPRVEGVSKTVGILQPWEHKPPILFGGVQTFEVGARGLSIPVTEKISLSLSKTSFVPEWSTRFSVEVPPKASSLDFSRASPMGTQSRILRKQLIKNIEFGGSKEVSVQLGLSRRVGEDLYFGLGGKVETLTLDPTGKIILGSKIENIGITKILTGKEKGGVGVIGGKVGGKGTSLKSFQEQTLGGTILKNIQAPKFIVGESVKSFETGIGVGALKLGSKIKQEEKTAFKTPQISGTILATKQLTKGETKILPRAMTTPISMESFKERTLQLPKISLKEGTLQEQDLALRGLSLTNFEIGIQTPTIPLKFPKLKLPFWLPSLGGLKPSGGSKKIPSTREYKYTPSFKALLLGIKGPKVKMPKGFTGFEVRPIPKGFEWIKKIKFKGI